MIVSVKVIKILYDTKECCIDPIIIITLGEKQDFKRLTKNYYVVLHVTS